MSHTTIEQPLTVQLRLASGQGPVTRNVLQTPPRDALPSETPVIDIARIYSPSLADRETVARDIAAAATNIGFFYIANHGVPEQVISDAHQTTLDFFRQDETVKMRSACAVNTAGRSGYMPYAGSRVNPDEGADHRESFAWTYDPRYDPTLTDEDVAAIPEPVRAFVENQHVDFAGTTTAYMPRFKQHIVAYKQAMFALARALTRSFALSLGLPETHFDAKVRYPDASLLLNYYPETKPHAPTEPLEQVSLGSHTDFRLFTILWQDQTGGLQILNPQGQWINARPVPGTFVVNIADLLQRITNDRYVSTVHRAHNWSGRERVSIPLFWGFAANETCAVVETCLGGDGEDGGRKKYDDIVAHEWVKSRMRQLRDWKN
ncbi:Oxoglutarate/iron-dependent oxygenase [Moelleriella libera RCEF 2490]|uniref:Oxoglutarate/iron-dependent oxygenase n=1 Tax=Moelleriella libera RCEF 2490 TaxID=1081109 RepID=A0A168EWB8_9HYPO|nr:Oxoglutarate/iron-dependent oxygenase [Moelleriella libera RCEF 2490]